MYSWVDLGLRRVSEYPIGTRTGLIGCVCVWVGPGKSIGGDFGVDPGESAPNRWGSHSVVAKAQTEIITITTSIKNIIG